MSRPAKRRRTTGGGNTVAAVVIVGGGALLLLLAALAFLGNRPLGKAEIEVAGQPRLKVDRALVDLGDVRLGQTVEATFVLANVGDRPLSLTRAPFVEVVEGC